ncbi:Villin-3 [Citrus sinensis]|uniref:Villin-3 n=1 Tax=Citrus sinensis TaxID=2711 RepID=A0ACB8HYA1_CITSI|nr:Villin-3 [Citrus sinensis]
MSTSAKSLDPAFQGAGQRVGTEIWRIENFQPVPLPKSEHGKFYMGDCYIVLQTTPGKGGAYLYDIHFWIGKDTSQDEAGTAAIKTVELDAVLGGRAVQHRELQGHESDKFLSYFKPCIIPLEGGVASGFRKTEEEEFETRLYVCKGKRVVRMKQVPFARSSLNHDDVFILDTKDKIYQFNGANSNIQERAKALEVIQFLKEKYHDGNCNVAIVDDGKLDTESDSGEFWVLFGGFAPIGKKVATEDDVIAETTPPKLYSIEDSQVKIVEVELSKSMLENNKCYLLDRGSEVFVWVGRVTQVEERKAASQAAEEFISSQNRPKSIRITRVIQGYETYAFKSNFDSWPSGSTAPGAEEGRGKVAALLKQQGVGIKGMGKSTPTNEEVPPLLEGGGKMEVWRINGSAKTSLPKEDIGKFYSGDCYIVLYTYHSGDRKEDYFLCCWFGKDSIEEDQKMATRLANTMCNSLKGRPVQGRIFQGREPPQFVALFQPMVVVKGGLCSGYKKSLADKGLTDETYTADSIALIRISGTSIHNNKTEQVDAVATSLNSSECFLLQSGSTMFTWHGNQSTFEQQQLAAKVAEFLKVEEVYNFSQDDLLTEDILILDTHAEVFVWVGQSVDSKEKQSAFEFGQVQGNSFQKKVALLFGASHAAEDKSHANQGGPTQRASALAALSSAFNPSSERSTSPSHDRSNGSNQGGPTQRASALAALSSAFKSSPGTKASAPKTSGSGQGSQRAAAVAALSQVLSAEKKRSPDTSPTRTSGSPTAETSLSSEPKAEYAHSESEASEQVGDVKETEEVVPVSESNGDDSETKQVTEQDENGSETSRSTFSYDQLKARSDNPVTGIDFKRREAYLSDEEFQTVFGMMKEAFYKLPKWKQDMQKKKFDLF